MRYKTTLYDRAAGSRIGTTARRRAPARSRPKPVDKEHCSGGNPMTEEVEVKVREVVENGKEASGSFVDALRKLLLAGIGAVALSRDETESFVNKLVERGEIAQKDAEKL